MAKCETQGCDEESEFIDQNYNKIFYGCMEQEIEEEGTEPESFERLS